MSETRFELIGVFQGARDLQRVMTDEAEADREAREIRAEYRRRGKGWAVYVVPHSCEPGGDCSCGLDIYAPRFGSDTLGVAARRLAVYRQLLLDARRANPLTTRLAASLLHGRRC